MDNIMSPTKLFERLNELKITQRKDKLIKGLGILRGGNTGLYESPDPAALSCPRKTILRSFFALEETTDEAKQFVFDAGLNSEYQLTANLAELCTADGSIELATQSEARTEWLTNKGTPVQGSPDAVIFDAKTHAAILGVEMKQVLSVYKCKSLLEEFIGADALAQAAHYSYQWGKIPFTVVYTSATEHHSFGSVFGGKVISAQERYKHLFNWNNKGEVKSLKGFRMIFHLVWHPDGNQVGVKFGGLTPDGGLVVNQPREDIMWTEITWKRIKAFYELCDDCEGKSWPDPPLVIDCQGKPKSFSLCDYCSLQPLCRKLGKKGSVAKLAEMLRREQRSS